MKLKCSTCGSVFSDKDNSHWVYGDGKDPTFGRCPHCKAIGRFNIQRAKGLAKR